MTSLDKRWRSALSLLLAAIVAVMLPTALAGPASAAPGDPFDPSVPTTFIAQDNDADFQMQLERAVVQPDGTVAYVPEGGEVPYFYNALAFNAADGYLYAVEAVTGQVLKIGQGGVVTRTAMMVPMTQANAFNSTMSSGVIAGSTYYTTCQACTQLYATDLVTGSTTTVNLVGVQSAPLLPGDLTMAGGFLWGIAGNGQIIRINPANGRVAYGVRPASIPGGSPYGSAWTLGNGDMVFQNNATGDLYQLRLDVTPTGMSVALVGVLNAPPATASDGAAAVGGPVDLGIVKKGPALYVAGTPITYDLTITNKGPGASSGAIVWDQLPAGLTYVSSTTACFDRAVTPTVPSCAAGATDLGFVVPGLPAGGSVTFSVTVMPSGTGPLTNTATVIANENDTNAANNTSSTTAVPPPPPSTIAVRKSLPDGRAHAADQFRLSITGGGLTTPSTGLTAGTEPGVQDQQAAEVAGPVVATGGTTYTIAEAAAGGADLADYVATWSCVDTRHGGALVAHGTGTKGTVTVPVAVTTGADVVCTFTNRTRPAIALTKTADRRAMVAGQTVTYTVRATNTGHRTLNGVRIRERAFNGLGRLSLLTGCSPALGGTLAPGASMTCTATYVVRPGDGARCRSPATRSRTAAWVAGTRAGGGAVVTASARTSMPALPAKPARPTATLPNTGGPSPIALATGLALLAAGAGLVLAGRRR